MRLHGLAPSTQWVYIDGIRGLAKYFGCSPEKITEEKRSAFKVSQPRHGLWRLEVVLGRAGRFTVAAPFSDDVTVVIFQREERAG